MDLNFVKRQLETSTSPRSAAVCPTQINLTETWSTIRTQIIRTDNNAMESQDWNVSQDAATNSSMKIFTSMMLRAWRRRRADVQRLEHVVETLQTSAMQTRNKLHVCNSLMRVEQKRCVDLQLELKKSTMSIDQVRNSCDMLNSSVLCLTADKQQLEQQLWESKNECERLKQQAVKSNEELLGALLEHRNLQHQLENEQRYSHQLLRQNLQLKDELKQLETSHSLELFEKQQQLQQLELQLNNSNFRNNNSAEPRQVFDLSLTTRRNFEHIIDWYSIDQFYTTLHYYAKRIVYLLWLAALPHKSLRNGCMPPKCCRITEQ